MMFWHGNQFVSPILLSLDNMFAYYIHCLTSIIHEINGLFKSKGGKKHLKKKTKKQEEKTKLLMCKTTWLETTWLVG